MIDEVLTNRTTEAGYKLAAIYATARNKLPNFIILRESW